MKSDRRKTRNRPAPLTAVVVALAALALSGCTTAPHAARRRASPAAAETPPHARLQPAQALFDAGDYNAALLACVDFSRTHPETPGLDRLRREVLAAIQAQQTRRALEAQVADTRRMSTEVLTAASLPDRYGILRTTMPLPRDSLSPASPMQAQLDQPVSLHLQGATLASLIAALSGEIGVNLIADYELGADQRITIEVEDLPLHEVLRYIARNLGVEFHVGDQVIWVTAADPSAAPLDTRIYRLRQGIQMHGSDWGLSQTEGRSTTGDIAMLTHKATVPSQEETTIERIIRTMVPEHPGASLYFDRGVHTLFVRNTRDNLKLIEAIVQALDVTPPQVLIEARFIEIMVDDLRELGVEWMLGAPWPLTTKGVMQDGVWTQADRTRVSEGQIGFTPFTSSEGGPHPLGPQGAFGLIGNPPTLDQGLNLSIEGVLTKPIFEAVLHALEISGKGRTLSMPRVTTMNNNPAKLRSGSDLRYFEEFQAQAFSLVDANNQKYTITALIPKGTPSMEELGITLVAVPSVGADRRGITLLLNPSISALDGFVSYQDDSLSPVPDDSAALIRQVVVKLPVFTRREVATKLTVQSGDTVVMGGLIDSIEQQTVHKVPILGDLPLLGALFRRTGMTEQRRNLLIFVTATVISDRGESLLSPIGADAEADNP